MSANSIAGLFIARILSGFGIGVASGTGNAWLAELVGKNENGPAAIIDTSSNFVGLGLAPLASLLALGRTVRDDQRQPLLNVDLS